MKIALIYFLKDASYDTKVDENGEFEISVDAPRPTSVKIRMMLDAKL